MQFLKMQTAQLAKMGFTVLPMRDKQPTLDSDTRLGYSRYSLTPETTLQHIHDSRWHWDRANRLAIVADRYNITLDNDSGLLYDLIQAKAPHLLHTWVTLSQKKRLPHIHWRLTPAAQDALLNQLGSIKKWVLNQNGANSELFIHSCQTALGDTANLTPAETLVLDEGDLLELIFLLAPYAKPKTNYRPSPALAYSAESTWEAVKQSIAQQLGVDEFKDNGFSRKNVPCPFHEDDSPSAGYNIQSGVLHCFACGMHSLQELAEYFQIALPSQKRIALAQSSLRMADRPRLTAKTSQQASAQAAIYISQSNQFQALFGRNSYKIALLSPTGGGKTTASKQLIDSLPSETRVLYITGNERLAVEASERLGLENYQAGQGIGVGLSNVSRLSITVASLHKIQPLVPYDLVIMDELLLNLQHLRSRTLLKSDAQARLTRDLLFQLLLQTPRVIVSDAHLGMEELRFLNKITPHWEVIEHQHQAHRDKKAIYYAHKSVFLESLFATSGERGRAQKAGVLLAVEGKKQGKFIATLAKKHGIPTEKILLINKHTSEDQKTRKFFSNPDKELLRYWLVIYTSTMGTGIDIQTETPVYGLFGGMIHDAKSVLQMLGRNRKAESLHLYIKGDSELDLASVSNLKEVYETAYKATAHRVQLPNEMDRHSQIFSEYLTYVEVRSRFEKRFLNTMSAKMLNEQGGWLKEIDTTGTKEADKQLIVQYRDWHQHYLVEVARTTLVSNEDIRRKRMKGMAISEQEWIGNDKANLYRFAGYIEEIDDFEERLRVVKRYTSYTNRAILKNTAITMQSGDEAWLADRMQLLDSALPQHLDLNLLKRGFYVHVIEPFIKAMRAECEKLGHGVRKEWLEEQWQAVFAGENSATFQRVLWLLFPRWTLPQNPFKRWQHLCLHLGSFQLTSDTMMQGYREDGKANRFQVYQIDEATSEIYRQDALRYNEMRRKESYLRTTTFLNLGTMNQNVVGASKASQSYGARASGGNQGVVKSENAPPRRP